MNPPHDYGYLTAQPKPSPHLETPEEAQTAGRMTSQNLTVWMLKPIVVIGAKSILRRAKGMS
jgi:hypothetical protein